MKPRGFKLLALALFASLLPHPNCADETPLRYRPWVNLSRYQGFSPRIISYGITGEFDTYYREKWWTFDKAEIGKKYQSIEKYIPPLEPFREPMTVQRPTKIEMERVFNYYKQLNDHMFKPKLTPKIHDQKKDPIDYGLSPEKYSN